jgi:hypothetical protein
MSVLRGTFRLSLVAALVALASPALAATMTADELLSMYRSGNEANRTVAGYWINGFIHGVMASSVNGGQDGKPIICPNPNVDRSPLPLVGGSHPSPDCRPDWADQAVRGGSVAAQDIPAKLKFFTPGNGFS